MSKLTDIAKQFLDRERLKALSKCGVRRGSLSRLGGLAGSSAAMALTALATRRDTPPLLVIGDSADDAGYLFHDLNRLLGEDAVMFLPSAYRRHIKYGQTDPAAVVSRTEALSAWHTDPRLRAVVTYPEAIAEKVVSEETIESNTRRLERGMTVDLTELEKWLRESGFSEVEYVYEPGQFAVRGSIVDIFSYSSDLPYRVDFFGDEIDSMRSFNVETQLSEQGVDAFSIVPDLKGGDPERPAADITAFVRPDTIVALRGNTDDVVAIVRSIASESFSTSASLAGDSDNHALDNVVDADRFEHGLSSLARVEFSAAPPSRTLRRGDFSFDFGCTPQGLYHKNFDLIAESLGKFIAEGFRIEILSDSSKQIERLADIFADRGDEIAFDPVMPTLHEGFVDHATHTCVFTDHQIFDRFHKYNLRSDRARSGRVAMSLKELNSISPGDYIVHIDHGVGRFGGLVRTPVNGHIQEMIKLVYQNDDVILVSIHSLHKLSKYRGKEGEPPKINKLGSGAWNKMKERTKSKLKEIARDLIRLYAARKQQEGFAFSPDGYMQHELEASFIYEDTPDQLTATRAVKADMESNKPMDRLICGDVGFGKTEIAIRAAFKAATDGKQTAVLVPTTVLAYQHFQTFSKRLADFPVRVDYLSRARTPAQVKEILADLAQGRIDIIIGTHKLIGKQVKFKDLGLLVVDEEQKFGVAVKEKLKQMKVNVDTLTMSATPIPRTLQFSLMGARDLSSIQTPPPNRHPIETVAGSLTDELLAEAVNFELSRNGQVFIINNRIEGLYNLEAMLRRVVPDARTIVAHGQMDPAKLEQSIIDFANHDYDVLLATTIVESGIDMPNVNTIIINNAQNFGLAELHQLRGRVGRSSRKAFCYLLVPPGMPLSPVARRRLNAIESFSDLGSGIHIAMQDLDIRGAGNLLGAEQSGFIADLGYETYQRILQEAVMELRTEEFAGVLPASDTPADDADNDGGEEFVSDCVIESDLELLLPATYVPLESERISLYRELDSIERELDLQAFRERLTDRFGTIPPETLELLRVPRLRRLARRLGIEKVNLRQGKMHIYFVDETNRAYYQSPMFGRLLNYLQQNPQRVRIRDNGGKRSFIISDVTSVETAVAILSDVVAMQSV